MVKYTTTTAEATAMKEVVVMVAPEVGAGVAAIRERQCGYALAA